ncbi:hypothetical protein [Aquibacillus albus]|uniref:FlaG/YvyC family protein n=1 Tax=Aquibacillus albus TaxID=1168171 RepID=A0ABS2MY33_9BACI|nr:hypothetical protein [Aquibacillus albus]MBM7570799.1 putative FlaG/YvyC family protein [Aquibacillus albus]
MKKLSAMFFTVLAVSIFLLGFDSVQKNEVSLAKAADPDIIKGVEKVLATVHELKDVLEKSPKDSKKIHKLGKKISEQWDVIEKKVEKKYPEAYVDIEKSLYPLIGFSKEEDPSVEKLQELIKQVDKKLERFKKHLG